MLLQDQVSMVLAYREFEKNLQGYAAAHEYASTKQARPSFKVAKLLADTKFVHFTDRELRLINDSI